jgi:hypothetical protein
MPFLLTALTFAAAFAYDWVEAAYVRAAGGGPEGAHRAARLSVAMYAVGFVGWVATVKVSLWLCLPEVAGLYLGSFFAVRRGGPPKVQTP